MAEENNKRGLGSADEKTREEVARKGGQSVPAEERSFSKDPELASEAGKKGGQNVAPEERSFSKDPELAREAGKKGGEAAHEKRGQQGESEEEDEGEKKAG